MTHKNPNDAFSFPNGIGSEEAKISPVPLDSPPPNPMGGNTLVVDSSNPQFYSRPSAALKEAAPNDQVFVRAGIYEDRIFFVDGSIQLIGAGRDHVQIFNRRSGTLYLQQVQSGRIEGITFRYLGSDQHSPINILDSTCTIKGCRAMEGILSGIVIYGSQCRPTLLENEVCRNRESGIFSFAGAQPYLTKNRCFGNYHFGIAVRDDGTRPDIVQNICTQNLLSGILLFYSAKALLLNNRCQDNAHWGLVTTPECQTSPDRDQLSEANILTSNPRGSMVVTTEPLAEIGR
ncbi:MAG: right-handed parallel beta-helix repeat-containing protein [Nitrospirales bacterium]|nr:right-handed parallel beta-helix repeat-containing protein [Nitrospirales bacterium]